MTKKKQQPIMPGITISKGITEAERNRFVAGNQGYVAPGVWVDAEGHYHFAMPEILAHMGLEHTPENEAWLREELAKKIRHEHPDSVVVQQHIIDQEQS